jgi:hypothetical protein
MALPKSARKITPTLSAWLASAVILMFTSPSLASGKAYQVEVIIFERGTHSSGDDPEGWQKNIPLEYPEHWQRLIDPTEEAVRQAQADQESSLHLSDDFLQTLAEERADGTQAAPSAGVQPSASDGPKYFEYLAEDARGLRQTRNALTRRNHYRVLFHETWLQPIGNPAKPLALVLHGGKRYGDHYELQGYINLSVSRFLHIQTDLWLSEFSVNYGQDIGHWPQLPLEPHLAASRAPSSDALDTELHWSDADRANPAPQRPYSNWSGGAESAESAESWAHETPYLVSQISTLHQKRRMRSGELHYLDHPRLGLLIKITGQ